MEIANAMCQVEQPYSTISALLYWGDMDRKIEAFCASTGATAKVAKDMVASHHGDVAAAIKSYNFMSRPQGPQKNMEPSRNSRAGGPAAPMSSSSAPTLPSIVTTGNPNNAGAGGTAPLSPSAMQRKYLKRGLSKTTDNIQLVTKARETVQHDMIAEDHTDGAGSGDEGAASAHFVDTPEYTFMVPDLSVFSDDLKAFMHKDLIETSTLVSLEQAGRLNWWADKGAAQRLWPMLTSGDGNCLLHAASISMWGFHDRNLTLRKTLSLVLTRGPERGSYWRRWRWHQTQVNKQSGLILSEEEWKTEWENCLELASPKPRTHPGSAASCCDSSVTRGLMERLDPGEKSEQGEVEGEVSYASLEEFHVFVLAHVLRRPIIIVADTILKDSNGEALAPIPFGGIYLPLLVKPELCHKCPCLLTYDAAHFSALVAMETTEDSTNSSPALPAAIPLVDPDFELLPIHFLVDPGPQFVWGRDEKDPKKTAQLERTTEERLECLEQYLIIERVPLPGVGAMNGDSPDSNPGNPMIPVVVNGVGDEAGKKIDRSVSSESDESTNGKDKKKNKQLTGVAKSFGSIGKSISKNIKKMGTLGKPEKKQRGLEPGSSVTQSNRSSASLSADMLRDKDYILCAGLPLKRLEYQDEFWQNYVTAAKERYKLHASERREQDAEIRRRAVERRHRLEEEEAGAECINAGCHGRGTAATSYLCQACFEKQKQEELRRDRSPGETYSRRGDAAADHVLGPDQLYASDSKYTAPRSRWDERAAAAAGSSYPAAPLYPTEGAGATVHLPSHGATTVHLPGPSERGANPAGGYRNGHDGDDLTSTKAAALGVVSHGAVPHGISSGVAGRDASQAFRRNETILAAGKSKFYTTVNEDHSAAPPGHVLNNYPNNAAAAAPVRMQVTREPPVDKNYHKPPLELARSSFYDESLTNSRPPLNVVNNLHKQTNNARYGAGTTTTAMTTTMTSSRVVANEIDAHDGASVFRQRQQQGAFRVKDYDYDKYSSKVKEYEKYDNVVDKFSDINIDADHMARAYSNGGSRRKCKTPQCDFYGAVDTDMYCSACYKTHQRALILQAERQTKL